jgi:hypothetical protein
VLREERGERNERGGGGEGSGEERSKVESEVRRSGVECIMQREAERSDSIGAKRRGRG